MGERQRTLPWIAGKEWATEGAPLLPVICPHDERHWADVEIAPQAVVEAAVQAARTALHAPEWAGLSPLGRGRLLLRWAALVRADADRLALLLSRENGKPASLAAGEIEVTARYFEYCGGYADKLDGRVVPSEPDVRAHVVYEPLGVVAHIIPWNYPADIFARGVAPCLAVGNTVVVKPAPQTSLIALELARLAARAGIPAGVVNVVTGDGETTGAALAASRGIDALAFCGSARGGKSVLHLAAENLTPVLSMELGGKSAAIIFPDVDVAGAAAGLCWSACYNSGQSCGMKSRVLVPADRKDATIAAMKAAFPTIGVGSLDDVDAFMGPLVSQAQLDSVLRFVERGVAEGAVLECGGRRMARRGYYMEPTLFSNVLPGTTLAGEEVFGPVVSLMTYETIEEAVRIANESRFGLSAELVTQNLDWAHRVAAQLDVSYVSINGGGNFGIDTPFGGVKQSGFGREGGIESLRQYARIKSVAMRLGR